MSAPSLEIWIVALTREEGTVAVSIDATGIPTEHDAVIAALELVSSGEWEIQRVEKQTVELVDDGEDDADLR